MLNLGAVRNALNNTPIVVLMVGSIKGAQSLRNVQANSYLLEKYLDAG